MTIDLAVQTALIAAFHAGATLAWVPASRHFFQVSSPALCLALSHVLALVVYILCCFAFGVAGLYTPVGAQVVFGLVSGLGCLFAIRHAPHRHPGKPFLRISWKGAAYGLPILATALVVRLADPSLYWSFPSSDYTAFATNLSAHLQNRETFTSYPSPLSLLFNGFQLGVDPWRRISLGNQVLSLGALVSIYAWSRSFCTKQIAILHTGIWAGAVFVLPILSMPLLYPQYTPVFTAFPLLMALEAEQRRKGNAAGCQKGIAVLMLLLSMCATYFAILISAVFLLNKAVSLCVRPSTWRATVWRSTPYLLPPVFILLYYQVLLPYFSHSSDLSLVQQSRDMLMYVDESREMYLAEIRKGYRYLGNMDALPPPVSAFLYFAFPGRFSVFRPHLLENLFVILSMGATVAVSIEALWTRAAHARATAVPMWILMISGFTGCLEIPGYQGRAAYLLSLPTLLYTFRYAYMACIWIVSCVLKSVTPRKTASEPLVLSITTLAVILCWIPSWISPPVSGKNINPRMSYVRRLPDHEKIIQLITSRRIEKESGVLLVDTRVAQSPKGAYLALPFGLYRNPWGLPVRYVTPPVDVRAMVHDHPGRDLFLLGAVRSEEAGFIGQNWEELPFRDGSAGASGPFRLYRHRPAPERVQPENGIPDTFPVQHGGTVVEGNPAPYARPLTI